jgi:hypothetical protein
MQNSQQVEVGYSKFFAFLTRVVWRRAMKSISSWQFDSCKLDGADSINASSELSKFEISLQIWLRLGRLCVCYI